MTDKLYHLAELIKLMAMDVSKKEAFWESESISDAIGLFENDLYFNEIKVICNGNNRSIMIGDTRGSVSRVNGREIKEEEHKGYMLLYNEKAPFYYQCFPDVEEIAERLQLVANRTLLTDKFAWYEKASPEALSYYAKVVTEHAEVLAKIGEPPKKIFEACK